MDASREVQFRLWLAVGVLSCLAFAQGCAAGPPPAGPRVNDITGLNPIRVERVATPHSIEEIQALVRAHPGPISIGGGRFSQGGQTATDNALFIDMREFNRVLAVSREDKTITVQPGITWRAIQEEIDPLDLSVKIMQTYSNFTVGGSLSVNVHGRYVGQGPVVRSVRSIKLVLADGTLVECSPAQRADLFYGAIGGYGGIGVIVEATLDLADNVKVERRVEEVAASDYRRFFFERIRDDPRAVFTNGDIYPPGFDTVNSVTWYQTDKPVTVEDRLIPRDETYFWQPRVISGVAAMPFGRTLREHVLDPLFYAGERVVWRNHEASYDVRELEPSSRERHTFVLQEYFVPVGRFDEFVPRMAAVFARHDVEVLNVSIRHALPDPGTLLAWAPEEVFAFVVYYRQGVDDGARAAVATWTREMADEILAVGGRWYLPYQPHASLEQFRRAYPRHGEYFALKSRVDPEGKFRNKLLERYAPTPTNELRHAAEGISAYRRKEVSTFMTVPEWYIVFNPEEYAEHLKDKPPSTFPYFSSIGEFWSLYGKVNDLNDPYPTDWGSHLMLSVIGTSYTAELLVKGSYENTIGRFTEWLSTPGLTAEDRAIQKANEDYVKFIYTYPWYEFPFWARLKEFWATSKWDEENRTREIERSLSFTMEYLVKAGYGWLIGLGSASAYEADAGVIYAIAAGVPAQPEAVDPRLKVVQRASDGRALIAIPRYEPFREVSVKLAAAGATFEEISGNRQIVVTAIVPAAWAYDLPVGRVVLDSQVVTDPSRKRLGIQTEVAGYARLLNEIAARNLKLEHVYDY